MFVFTKQLLLELQIFKEFPEKNDAISNASSMAE